MMLSAKMLKNVDSLNAWASTEQWVVRNNEGVGENVSLYFQLVDLDRESIRYIASTGATMQVTFPNLDDSLVITVNASNPFPEDRSIWKVDLLSTQMPSSGNVKFSITESGNTKTFSAFNAIQVQKVNSECC